MAKTVFRPNEIKACSGSVMLKLPVNFEPEVEEVEAEPVEVYEGPTVEELRKEAEKPRLKVPDNKPAYDLQETAILLDITYNEVRELIRSGELEAKKYGNKMYVIRDDIQWFLFQQKLNHDD